MKEIELATGYSELVDLVIQRERLVEQSKLGAGGELEAMGLALAADLAPEYAILIGSIAAPLAKWADKTEKEYGLGSK